MSDLPYDVGSFDLIHLRFAHTRVSEAAAVEMWIPTPGQFFLGSR